MGDKQTALAPGPHWETGSNMIREFSAQERKGPTTRTSEDAPQPMRQELVDLFFSLAEHHEDEIPSEHIYRVTCQSSGIDASGAPYGGFRYATGRDIRRLEWPRVYDLIARLWPDFDRLGLGRQFQEGVNRILAAYGAAWDLGYDGRLSRVLPHVAQAQLEAAIAELSDERFEPALELFKAARDAFDARPRRDRDACCNAFDAAESVAKVKLMMPDATFGQVIARVRQMGTLSEQIVGVLESINALRNRNFGHGMATLFSLTAPEVDFTYLTCVAAVLLFARMI